MFKKFLVIFAVLFSVALVSGCGKKPEIKSEEVLVSQEQAQTGEKPENTSGEEPQELSEKYQAVDTSNWKTFRDEELGFEFKYPENWKIRNSSYDDSIEFTVSGEIEKLDGTILKDQDVIILTVNKYYKIQDLDEARLNNIKANNLTDFINEHKLFEKIGEFAVNDKILNEIIWYGHFSTYNLLFSYGENGFGSVCFAKVYEKSALSDTEKTLISTINFFK